MKQKHKPTATITVALAVFLVLFGLFIFSREESAATSGSQNRDEIVNSSDSQSGVPTSSGSVLSPQ